MDKQILVHYSAIKRNKLMINAKPWMNVKGVMPMIDASPKDYVL